jgi:uncharacterized protein
MLEFAVMYLHGLGGVTLNYAEALRWYRAAARAGNTEAMNDLAFHLDNGTRFTRNATEASAWRRASAEAGDSTGMLSLAYSLYYSRDIAKKKEALRWAKAALAAGNESAKGFIDSLNAEGVS